MGTIFLGGIKLHAFYCTVSLRDCPLPLVALFELVIHHDPWSTHYISCMDSAYVRNPPPPKVQRLVQHLLFWYLKSWACPNPMLPQYVWSKTVQDGVQIGSTPSIQDSIVITGDKIPFQDHESQPKPSFMTIAPWGSGVRTKVQILFRKMHQPVGCQSIAISRNLILSGDVWGNILQNPPKKKTKNKRTINHDKKKQRPRYAKKYRVGD